VTVAERLEKTVENIGRSGYLEPGTIRAIAHCGAGEALHVLFVRLIEKRQCTGRMVDVLDIITEEQKALQEMKLRHEVPTR
jgi:hypothetical protein